MVPISWSRPVLTFELRLVFFDLTLVDPLSVSRMIEVLVLIATRPVHRDEQRYVPLPVIPGNCTAIVRLRNHAETRVVTAMFRRTHSLQFQTHGTQVHSVQHGSHAVSAMTDRQVQVSGFRARLRTG